MKLLRLRLENFRQHRDSDIRFADGMTAIVGANGTGKTTILEAITFALYGVQRKTRDGLKFYWAEPRGRLKVTLEFEFDGCTYRLERTATDAALTDVDKNPPVVKATGLREVKSVCERLLRLTYDQFKNSFCAEQKSLAFLQFSTDTRRQEQVAKMLGFDRLKTAADLARERGRGFRAIANAFEAQLGNIDELRAQRTLARDEFKHAERTKREVQEIAEAVQQQLPPVQERKLQADEYVRLSQEAAIFASNAEALKSARKRAEEVVAISKNSVEVRKGLEPDHAEFLQLEKALRDFQELREQEIEREGRQAELARLKEQIRSLDAEIAALKPVDGDVLRKEVQAKISAHTAAVNALRQAEAAWGKARQSSQGNLSTARAEHRQAEQALVKANDLISKGVCPECGQPTTGDFATKIKCLESDIKTAAVELASCETAFSVVEQKPKAIFDAEDKVDACRTAHEQAQNALTEGEKLLTQMRSLRDQRAACVARVEALSKDLDKTAAKYDRGAHVKAESRAKELRPRHEAYLKLAGADEALVSAAKQLAEASREIDEARAGYKALIDVRSKLPFKDAEESRMAKVEFEDLQCKIVQAEANLKIADALIQSAVSKLAQAEDRIKLYEETEASLKESRSEALLHECADKELKQLREELNAVIRPDLESRASDTLSLLTNGRYPLLELDEEFNPTVVEDGISKQVISGGEEDVVALALRMALSELIQERQGRPMSLLILDEVFGSLDTDRRQAVLERLQGIKGRFAQILVISHIEEINQVADQCIFLTRDPETRATVVGDLPLETGELVLS